MIVHYGKTDHRKSFLKFFESKKIMTADAKHFEVVCDSLEPFGIQRRSFRLVVLSLQHFAHALGKFDPDFLSHCLVPLKCADVLDFLR